MLDAIYQSLICFYMTYLLFAPATFNTESGQGVDDTSRMGVFAGCAAIMVVNAYVLLNTYRWDWLTTLIVTLSILLIWFWTGVYTASTNSELFYRAAAQVYSQLSFWALLLLTVSICLLPRFTAKAIQKLYLPYDVDIIREQIRQGRFNYLNDEQAYGKQPKASSTTSSDLVQPAMTKMKETALPDDERPIYPPSVAPTATTHNPRSQNGSDGTDYTGHRRSLEPPRPKSFERPRPSFDRFRNSMERTRASFEASHDFTSAAMLTRLESSQCPGHSRRAADITSELR